MSKGIIVKLSRDEIRQLVYLDDDGINDEIKDEMAIPSYLHSNFLIRWLMWRRYECIAELANFNRDMSAFEFGCGIGVFLPTLSNNVSLVYANDLFPQFAKRLCENRRLDVKFVNNVKELPDDTLDLIIAADVMEHIESPGNYISMFAKKLMRNGRFIMSGPTENIIYKIGRVLAGFKDKGDYHYSNIDKLAVIVQKNSFRIQRIRTLPLRVPPFLFKIIEFRKV